MEFTPEDLQNILMVLSKAQITGREAAAIAVLMQKVQGQLEAKPVEKKEEKK